MPETPEPAGKPCPICGKPMLARYRPFCSKRCADVDLHRWFAGAYAVPVEEEQGTPSEAERLSGGDGGERR